MTPAPTGHPRPLAVVTCGPAHAPIDGVRRITNFATGEIGAVLSRSLMDAGCEVICFRGEGATAPPPEGVDVRPFATNASLSEALQALPRDPDLVLHAAALCDFEVVGVEGATGDRKLSSRSGELVVRLRPTPKILPQLREWFPAARIIGWKYELDGTREDALAKARLQIDSTRSDACVINGSAYGQGFGIVSPGIPLIECPDKPSLARTLLHQAGWNRE